MKLPSKITSYSESALSKFPQILSKLQNSDIGIYALYEYSKQSFSSIEEYLDTLDYLFALRKVKYDAEREVLCYVE